jgi:hypothetical protein
MPECDQLRRRDPGPKVLIYLDQSSLSSLALEEEYSDLKQFLIDGLEAGQLVCPASPEHRDETVGGDQGLYAELHSLKEQLSDGIEFRFGSEIVWSEIHAIARDLKGESAEQTWDEAFDTDPQTPRDDLYMEFLGGQIRVTAHFPPSDDDREEVERLKEIEEIAQGDYERLRGEGLGYEETVERFFTELVNRDLGVWLAPEVWRPEYERRVLAMGAVMEKGEVDLMARSPYSRYQAYWLLKAHTENLLKQHPEIAETPDEFRDALKRVPTLRFPAFLRASLVHNRERKARPGDGYDIDHLTRGLSRCDVVTADRGMVHVVEERKLAPAGCAVVRTADQEGLRKVIEEKITEAQ